jgi:hypothetical protein
MTSLSSLAAGADGPVKLAEKFRDAKGLSASGKLSFLNDWSYVLGSDVLTHFGRQQLCTYFFVAPYHPFP